MPHEELSSNSRRSAAKSSSSTSQPPKAVSPSKPAAVGGATPSPARSPQGSADKRSKRTPKRFIMDLRRGAKKVRLRGKNAPKATVGALKRAAQQLHQAPPSEQKVARNGKESTGASERRQQAAMASAHAAVPSSHAAAQSAHAPAKNAGQQHAPQVQPAGQPAVHLAAPTPQPPPAAQQAQVAQQAPQQAPQPPAQEPAHHATAQQPAPAKQLAKKTAPPPSAYSWDRPPRKYSIMNLAKLARDGRKTPDHYREVARRAASPSIIDLKSLTEFYDTPNDEFETLEEVYEYRGYKRSVKLDEGAFGVVYKALRVGDNLPVALKEVDLTRRRSKRIEEMKRELFVLQRLDSPCIVKLVEHFIVASTLVIIMEYCAGSNLTAYLKEGGLNEEEAQHLFRQMATGIKIMHRASLAHRDVKLNNFLLDGTRKNIKIADFGLSVMSYKPERGILLAKTYCGTEPYMAPEIIRRNARGIRLYNPMTADVWALGVCLYAMLTRTFPFKMNLTQKSLLASQTARRWRIPRALRDIISEDLKDLLWHMLDPDWERRITMIGVMSHPWLNPDMVTLTHVD